MFLFSPSTTSHLAIITQVFWLIVLLRRAMKRSTTASDAPVDRRFLAFLVGLIGAELIIILMSSNLFGFSRPAGWLLAPALIVVIWLGYLFYAEIGRNHNLINATVNIAIHVMYAGLFVAAAGFTWLHSSDPSASWGWYRMLAVAIAYTGLLAAIWYIMRQSWAAGKDRIAKMLRSFLTYSLLPLLAITLLVADPVRIWMLVAIDVALFFTVFGITVTYFNYQHYAVSLENRIVGTGVTLFLVLTNSFGWILSLLFLRQQLSQQLPLDDVFRENPALVLGFNPTIQSLALRIEISSLLIPIGFFIVIGSAILFFLLRMFYRNVITAPVSAILKGIRAVEAGDYAANVDLHHNDEIGQIALSFNQMTDQLSDTTTELKRYQQQLEELVEERTKNLIAETEARMDVERDAAIQKAVEEERKRAAHETHDGLLQRLAGAKLRMAHWHRLLNTAHQQMHDELDLLNEQLSLGTLELRQLMDGVPVGPIENRLEVLIPDLVRSARTNYRLEVHTELQIDETRLKPGFIEEIYRIFQEGVANCGRAGDAGNIWLSAIETASKEAIRIEIRDDGVTPQPMNTVSTQGVMLDNIRVRVESLNGTLNITNESEVGTTLVMHLPYPMFE